MLNSIGQLRKQSSDNMWLWLRPVLVIGVLALSVFLASQVSRNRLSLVLGLFVALGVVIIALRQPGLGLVVACLSGMLVPFSGPSGVNTTMVLIALLTGLWILDMAVRDQEIRLVPSRITRPAIFLVVAACLSFLAGQLPWFTFVQPAPLGAQLGGLSLFILSACAFLLGANQIDDLRWLQRMVWAFLACATVFLLLRSIPILNPLLSHQLLRGGEFRGLLMIWFGSLAFSQVLFNQDLRPRWRLVLAVLVVVIVYYNFVLKYNEKSGWMPLLIGLGIIVGARSWRWALALIILGALPAWYLGTEAFATDEYSYYTRVDALVIMLEIIETNPLLGLGPANYRWYTPLFAIRGFAVEFNSHNNYADIVAQTGLVGLVAFLWFYAEVGWLAWKLRNRVTTGFARAYVYGAIGATAATLVVAAMADMVIPFFYNIGMMGFRATAVGFLFSGGLVSLERLALKPAGKKEE